MPTRGLSRRPRVAAPPLRELRAAVRVARGCVRPRGGARSRGPPLAPAGVQLEERERVGGRCSRVSDGEERVFQRREDFFSDLNVKGVFFTKKPSQNQVITKTLSPLTCHLAQN